MSEQNRETIEIVTPVDAHKVVIKSYITGGELREMENVFLRGQEQQLKAGEKPSILMTVDLVDKSQDAKLALIVVSIDGNPEPTSIIPRLLDFRSKDFSFVVAKVNEVIAGETSLKKA